jgi:ABC-type multidrug transport system fused ATPase/permease subunit
LKAFLNALVQLVTQKLFLRDIFMFLDIEINRPEQKGVTFPAENFDIDVKNLSYKYPGSHKYAIQDVNMTMRKGQLIGLVGANGSGKSTLVKLLAGLYDAAEGEIKVGLHPLAKLDTNSYRESTMFLYQDFEKYYLSVEDIVKMGVPVHNSQIKEDLGAGSGERGAVSESGKAGEQASGLEEVHEGQEVQEGQEDQEGQEVQKGQKGQDGRFSGYRLPFTQTEMLKAALEKADAWSFVEALPEGVKTKMGRIFKDGAQLSGGQWQKLAIARAFYRSPQVIVLDEPTSALDAIAENSIFSEFKSMRAERITLVISHRLYNLKDCDYIYVMDEGRMVQEGTFAHLTQVPGLFQELYKQQS